MGGQLGLLGDQRRIDIDRPPAALGQQRHGAPQQDAAVGALVARVGIGKMAADIAQRHGAEQGIGDRVQQRIGVGMPEQPRGMRYLDTAEDELATCDQLVNVVTLAYPEIHLRPLKIIAARARSAG